MSRNFQLRPESMFFTETSCMIPVRIIATFLRDMIVNIVSNEQTRMWYSEWLGPNYPKKVFLRCKTVFFSFEITRYK